MLRHTIAIQTLNNENYEGDITLSSKDSYSALWGGTLPNILGWSTAGVYAEIHLETDKHLFKGSLQLAPPGPQKTTWFGLENIPVSLNYGVQKGAYKMYSNFSDFRLTSYFYVPTHLITLAIVNPGQAEEYLERLDSDMNYMTNTLMYLENAISIQTDGEYDAIYPYMMYTGGTFIPTFQFGGSNSKLPVPEFYHEYPIFVDDSNYQRLQGFYSTIYKVFDNTTSQEIQLIPEDGAHKIYGDVDHIDAYLMN